MINALHGMDAVFFGAWLVLFCVKISLFGWGPTDEIAEENQEALKNAKLNAQLTGATLALTFAMGVLCVVYHFFALICGFLFLVVPRVALVAPRKKAHPQRMGF